MANSLEQVFTVQEREELRRQLVSAAEADARVVGAALTGSAAINKEDPWSDIDLALSIDRDLHDVIGDWTRRMYELGAVGHLDVWHGKVLFRVFLTTSALQVDIAFWPSSEFGATGPTFKLLFGEPNELPHSNQPRREDLVGWAWLYAVHARSSIARDRVWQALYMINHMRDQVMALWCLRSGVNAVQGRGLDDLPQPEAFTGTIPLSTHPDELRRAFTVLTELLLDEIDDAELAAAVRSVPHGTAP